MARQDAKAVTPELRFPEFRVADGWQFERLGDICDVLNNRRRPITSSEREPGPFPYYGASGVVDFVNDYIFDERLVLVGEDGAKWGRFESTAFIAEGKYWVNNHAHVLKPSALNDTLLQNYLTMLDLAPFVTGAAPPKLTLAKLKSIPIPVPRQAAEQHKIADCLTSLDEVIAAQGRKVEALKAHKRGLMQQLFPREGTRPRLRFPEFRNAKDWGSDKLHNFLAISATYGIVKAGEFQSEGVPMLRGGDIKDGCIGSGLPLVTKEIHSQYKRTKLQENDVVIALVGYPGEAAVIPKRYVGANISRAVGLLRAKAELSASFLVCFLNSPVGRRTVLKPSAGSAQVVVNLKQLNDLVIPVPSFAEQVRIADVLSSLDIQITAGTSQLTTLQNHKQGLMQQLFPGPEATGA